MLKRRLSILITLFSTFTIQTAYSKQKDPSNSCLDLIKNNSRLGALYSDFYYDKQLSPNDETFASTLYKKVLDKVSEEKNCTLPKAAISSFSCLSFNSYPVCSASVGKKLVTVVKDYTDFAHLLVQEAGNSRLPKIKSKNHQRDLYMPHTGYYYEILLGGSWESQTYDLDIKEYRNYNDLRWVIARAARDIVTDAQKVSRGTSLKSVIKFPAKKVTCETFSNTKVRACLVNTQSSGYFICLFAPRSTNAKLIFNRWD